ncbi:MAG: ergothioneine biosynthesis protein EgtB [Candidatus Eisenbacteria bacterium]
MERATLYRLYGEVRRGSTALSARLSPEDCVAQSMPDASPVKWHLAHTSWFFETFALLEFGADYRPFDPAFAYLFNSYYNTVGEQYPRPRRGLITRPGMREVTAYREHVDAAMSQLLEEVDDAVLRRLAPVIELGLNHEEQHQELILTDLKHLLSQNPTHPRYVDPLPPRVTHEVPCSFRGFDGGLLEVGYERRADADGSTFSFDNEGPRHKVWLEPFSLADRLVTCGEYLAFMQDHGYERPELWLSDGWAARQSRGWTAPLYWRRRDDGWWHYTMTGLRRIDPNEPLCHVSLYEADAYARWAEARLPTEFEWEVAAVLAGRGDHFAPSAEHHPRALERREGDGLAQMFGDVWEWTASAYLGYPGYKPVEGALGEYNGKFMSNQYVLRGGSCATPRRHFRASYRNFFPPDARWQFTGLRLAR